MEHNNNKENRGGKRAGAGRKRKKPTRTISVRVPANEYEKYKAIIKAIVPPSPPVSLTHEMIAFCNTSANLVFDNDGYYDDTGDGWYINSMRINYLHELQLYWIATRGSLIKPS